MSKAQKVQDADLNVCVSRLLYRLGKTSDEIAQSLKSHAAFGSRRDSLNDPLVSYLKKMGLNQSIKISVKYFNIYGQTETGKLPKAITEFINRFDDGMYSFLDKNK